MKLKKPSAMRVNGTDKDTGVSSIQCSAHSPFKSLHDIMIGNEAAKQPHKWASASFMSSKREFLCLSVSQCRMH